MRWLIVGPYPPERGSGPDAAAAFVAARLGVGDTVHTLSPRPSAAHVHQPVEGARSLWLLRRIARRERAGGLWLRVEPGILLRPGVDRWRAFIERVALAFLLRHFSTSVIDVGDVGLLPGGRAGRIVFSSATRFVAHAEPVSAALVANGAPPSKVELAVDDLPATSPAGLPGLGHRPRREPPDLPPPIGLRGLPGVRADIEAAIRARARQVEVVGGHAAGPAIDQ